MSIQITKAGILDCDVKSIEVLTVFESLLSSSLQLITAKLATPNNAIDFSKLIFIIACFFVRTKLECCTKLNVK